MPDRRKNTSPDHTSNLRFSVADLSESKIIRQLAIVQSKPTDNPYPPSLLYGQPQKAAVLLPFLVEDSTWKVLFIRRTENDSDRHGGQVAFPGGRSDAEDPDPETTALRETHEEIGVDPQDIRILGRLNDILTISNYLVTPVVGVIPWPYELQLSPSEVSRAFTIPLAWLCDPENRKIKERFIPDSHIPIKVIYFREYQGEILWGASARITLNLIRALNHTSPR
jgi:8-oxo-dGTP pyrophosphatase MutT (NUDIX family)